MNRNKLIRAFVILLGIFLIVEGIWGLFSPVVFAVLSTNKTHAALHIILGTAGIYFANTGGTKSYCSFLGILLMGVGILHFVPGPDELILKLLNVNNAVAYLNIIVGVIALIFSFLPSENEEGTVNEI